MDYSDPEACLEKLNTLNPTNVDHAYTVLVEMLGALLLGTIPDAKKHIEVLEAGREPLALIQDALAQRYTTHPLPPNAQENQTLLQVVSLWRLMARSYAQIARRHDIPKDGDNLPALLAQRRVFYCGQIILEYFRARRELPEEAWASLHKAFMAAEEQGVANVRVADVLNEVWREQSAIEAFITILMIDLASPYGRSRRELEWVFRWAQRFAPFCTLEAVTEEVGESKSYGLDLDADHGLRPLNTLGGSGEHRRRFDGSRLAEQIREMVDRFKQGVKPSALGLGEDTSASACARLLVSLYRPWGLASAERRFTRRHVQGEVELSGDWKAIGFHIQGKVFEPPSSAAKSNIRADLSLRTFGERVEEVPAVDVHLSRRLKAEKQGLACEYWQVVDESLDGFRLERRAEGIRLSHKQLVCLLPPGSERFLIGRVSWLMYREDGVLEIGVNLLAGVPKVIAVRQTGLNTGKRGVYQQGFLLSATPALKKPETLVIPPSWYQANRVIEIYNDKPRELRLTRLKQRGANFDHSEFEYVSR